MFRPSMYKKTGNASGYSLAALRQEVTKYSKYLNAHQQGEPLDMQAILELFKTFQLDHVKEVYLKQNCLHLLSMITRPMSEAQLEDYIECFKIVLSLMKSANLLNLLTMRDNKRLTPLEYIASNPFLSTSQRTKICLAIAPFCQKEDSEVDAMVEAFSVKAFDKIKLNFDVKRLSDQRSFAHCMFAASIKFNDDEFQNVIKIIIEMIKQSKWETDLYGFTPLHYFYKNDSLTRPQKTDVYKLLRSQTFMQENDGLIDSMVERFLSHPTSILDAFNEHPKLLTMQRLTDQRSILHILFLTREPAYSFDKFYQMLELLLAKGAGLATNLRDIEGKTPLDYLQESQEFSSSQKTQIHKLFMNEFRYEKINEKDPATYGQFYIQNTDPTFIYLRRKPSPLEIQQGMVDKGTKELLGWKLHISLANIQDIQKAWDIMVDILVKHQIDVSKVLRKNIRFGELQHGKEITLYYQPGVDWKGIIEEATVKFVAAEIKPGYLAIPDKQVPNSEYFSVRNDKSQHNTYLSALEVNHYNPTGEAHELDELVMDNSIEQPFKRLPRCTNEAIIDFYNKVQKLINEAVNSLHIDLPLLLSIRNDKLMMNSHASVSLLKKPSPEQEKMMSLLKLNDATLIKSLLDMAAELDSKFIQNCKTDSFGLLTICDPSDFENTTTAIFKAIEELRDNMLILLNQCQEPLKISAESDSSSEHSSDEEEGHQEKRGSSINYIG